MSFIAGRKSACFCGLGNPSTRQCARAGFPIDDLADRYFQVKLEKDVKGTGSNQKIKVNGG